MVIVTHESYDSVLVGMGKQKGLESLSENRGWRRRRDVERQVVEQWGNLDFEWRVKRPQKLGTKQKAVYHLDDFAVIVSNMLRTRIVRETVLVTGWRIPTHTTKIIIIKK